MPSITHLPPVAVPATSLPKIDSSGQHWMTHHPGVALLGGLPLAVHSQRSAAHHGGRAHVTLACGAEPFAATLRLDVDAALKLAEQIVRAATTAGRVNDALATGGRGKGGVA